MTRKKLTTGNSVNDANTFQTAAVAPAPNTLVLAFVINARSLATTAPAIPTAVGNDTAWVLVETVTAGRTNDRRLSCFRSMANAPTAGPITFSFGGETQDFCAWSILQYDTVDTSGTSGSGAISHSSTARDDADVTSLVATLPLAADPSHNTAVGAVLLPTPANESQPLQPGPGMAKVDEQDLTQFLARGATLQTQDAAPARADVQWTWTTPGPAAAIVVEVAAEPVSPGPSGPTPQPSPTIPVDELVRRFAPVLTFHPEEVFFPVDAKRYLEHAAMWNARAAFDETRDWGGVPADPFPRKPSVPAGALTGLADEGGTFIGDPKFVLAGSAQELFLELGGWKNRDSVHEPEVTTDSANTYADRAEIARRYREPALEASQYWYHAEAFDYQRLKTIAGRTGTADLLPLFERFKDPVLLCYYLFFAAHEHGVGEGTCTNIEAKENGCHAGDWQCVAILLQGDGSGSAASFNPAFYGVTGIQPAQVDVDGNPTFRPYQYDSERRTAMKVEAWRPATGPTANQPEVEQRDHAHLFVARGSHSLYATPGDHELDVQPYSGPSDCGRSDTVTITTDDWPASGWLKSAAFNAKILTGGAFGPIGAIAGVVAAAAELKHWLDDIPDPFSPTDQPNPDRTAPPSAGITVRPPGVDVAGVAADRLKDWRAQQNTQIDGRRYDVIVDRATQKWWPSDDGATGFLGRWGQRVAEDSTGRRAGPTFPDFAAMFLFALADGDHRALLDLNT